MWGEGAARPSFLQPVPFRHYKSDGVDERTIICGNSERSGNHVYLVGNFIETPHPEMASRAARSPSDAVDLAAYILSLKQK